MELKDYLRIGLDNLERGIKRAVNGLTQEELAWRPACGCNSIGLILFHVARSEDSFINARLQSKPEVWKTGQWYTKLNVPENEAGAHYTVEQVNAFPVSKLEDVMAYYAAVREKTLDYLKSMKAADFDNKMTMPRGGDTTVAGIFSIVISHTSGHIGEISYLRGLQRGMDK